MSIEIKKPNEINMAVDSLFTTLLPYRIDNKVTDFMPFQINEQGDWIDVKAADTYHLKEGESALISLGFAMKIPYGYEAWLAPRSSTFKKWGVIQTNSIGIIDNSYSGDNDIWMMPVLAMRDTTIEKGDRIAQFRLIGSMGKNAYNPSTTIILVEVDSLGTPDRGGFGSTGSK